MDLDFHPYHQNLIKTDLGNHDGFKNLAKDIFAELTNQKLQ